VARERAFFLTEEDRFFEEVPRLFAANQARESTRYEAVIYALKPQATSDAVKRVAAFVGAPQPRETEAVARALNQAIATSQYPSAQALLEFKGLGIDLPLATALVHFFRPAFPLYRVEAVASLQALGYAVEHRTTLDEEGLGAYEGVVAAIDRLKLRIPYPFVPESNCFLTRVVEGALVARALKL